MKRTPWDALVMALFAIAIAVGAWQWQQSATRAIRPAPVEESWRNVQERYPAPKPLEEESEIADALLQGIVKSNPFSPARHLASQPPEEASAEAPAAPEAIPPKFIYKGHVLMGTKQRAIVEDVNIKKTYFLQVGQEVAGFKVLDITEGQVVLSDPQSSAPLTLTLTPKETSAAQ